jgi:hypothetical protein
MWEPDRSVGITTNYWLDGLGSIPQQGLEIISASHGPHRRFPMGAGALSHREKRPRFETNYALQSSVEVNNGGAVPPLLYILSWRGA